MRYSIRAKLIVLTLLPMLVAAVVFVSYSAMIRLQALEDAMDNTITLSSQILAGASESALVLGQYEQLQDLVDSLVDAREEIIAIELQDVDQETVVQSPQTIDRQLPAYKVPVFQYLEPGLALSDNEEGEAAPVVANERRQIGTLIVRPNEKLLAAQVRQLLVELVVSMAVALFAILLLSTYIDRTINRPIDAVSAAMRRIKEGDFGTHITGLNDDEMGRLGAQVNATADELAKQQLEIRERESELIKAHTEADAANLSKIHVLRQFIAGLQRPLKVASHNMINIARHNRNEGLSNEVKIATGNLHSALDMIADCQSVYGEKGDEEGNSLSLRPKGWQLAALLRRTLDTVEQERQEKETEIDISVTGEQALLQAEVFFDGDRFKQIICYMLRGAISSAPGNRIFLALHLQSMAGSKVSASISVRDTGAGLDRDHLDALNDFLRNREQQLLVSDYSAFELRIMRELGKLLGADIMVRSRQGLGTTFICDVDMPLNDAERASMVSSQKPHILFVGSASNASYIGDMVSPLSEQYHQISMTDTEMMALQQDSFDMIFVDCTDLAKGMAACQALCHYARPQSSTRRYVAALFKHQAVSEEISYRLFDSGFTDVFTKPFSSRTFAKLLERQPPTESDHEWMRQIMSSSVGDESIDGGDIEGPGIGDQESIPDD